MNTELISINMDMKRFYQQYLDLNTGEHVIFDADSSISMGVITLEGNYIYTISHNQNTYTLLCLTYDETNNFILPDKLRLVDLNTIEITVTSTELIKIILIT